MIRILLRILTSSVHIPTSENIANAQLFAAQYVSRLDIIVIDHSVDSGLHLDTGLYVDGTVCCFAHCWMDYLFANAVFV